MIIKKAIGDSIPIRFLKIIDRSILKKRSSDHPRISVCKLWLALSINKEDTSFKHHENTTSQKLFIKIHHPNQHLDVDPTKPKQSKIEVAMKRKYRVKNVTCDIKFIFIYFFKNRSD